MADRSVTELLDAGREGLRYFAVFGPRHARIATEALPWESATARYDEQVGIDTVPLRCDADVVRRSQAGIGEELDVHDAQRRTVAGSWSGASSDAAHAALASAGQAAEALHRWLSDVATGLEVCADLLTELVSTKADHVRELRADRVAGSTPEQLDELIELAEAEPGDPATDERVATLSEWFTARGAQHLVRVPSPTPETRARAIDFAADHLRKRVVPEIEATWQGFDRRCRSTDDAVRTAWEDLAVVLERCPETAPVPAALHAAPGRSGLRLGDADVGSPDPAPPPDAGFAGSPGDQSPDAQQPSPAQPSSPQPSNPQPSNPEPSIAQQPAGSGSPDGGGAAVHAAALHGGPVTIGDPGVLSPDASGHPSAAVLASAAGPSQGGVAGAVLAGDGGTWNAPGRWPWEDVPGAGPGAAPGFSLASLLELVRDALVVDRGR